MPLIIDGDRTPARGSGDSGSGPASSADKHPGRAELVRIALINNMPDSALTRTESQFFELLKLASENIPVSLTLFSLPELPRGERAQKHLKSFYSSIKDLWNQSFDGVIITGTEPRRPDLRDEPYWDTLVKLLDWAERNTASSVLSCLAAHAGVFHSDGIERHALSDKRFGVFDYKRVCDNPLLNGTPDLIQIPHSRWNEVREDALISCGYEVLTKAAEAGVDLFLKMKKKSLFVHFQGHPEYGAPTLLKEYKRDIGRFLRGERKLYPPMPQGYFDAASTHLLVTFQERVHSNPHEELLTDFPEAFVTDTLQNTWQPAATRIYRNWLEYIASKKSGSSISPPMVRVGHR